MKGRAGPAEPDASDDDQVLQQGATRLGLSLSSAQQGRLEQYLDLLQRWGRTYNLTAILDRPAMRVQHLLDSLALVPHLPAPSGTALRPAVLLDVGSGAGLPGVVVAVACPDWRVVCVDAVAKKVGFIRQVAAELALSNLHGVHTRIEHLAASADWTALAPHGAQVITSRAFASLTDFLGATRDLAGAGGEWLAMKGQVPTDEIAAWQATQPPPGNARPDSAPGALNVIELQVPGLDARRCLVRYRR